METEEELPELPSPSPMRFTFGFNSAISETNEINGEISSNYVDKTGMSK
jgi:hypothetical protein